MNVWYARVRNKKNQLATRRRWIFIKNKFVLLFGIVDLSNPENIEEYIDTRWLCRALGNCLSEKDSDEVIGIIKDSGFADEAVVDFLPD